MLTKRPFYKPDRIALSPTTNFEDRVAMLEWALLLEEGLE